MYSVRIGTGLDSLTRARAQASGIQATYMLGSRSVRVLFWLSPVERLTGFVVERFRADTAANLVWRTLYLLVHLRRED